MVSKKYHKLLPILSFLQNKPQVTNMKNKYYDLYYTVIENRDDKENVNRDE